MVRYMKREIEKIKLWNGYIYVQFVRQKRIKKKYVIPYGLWPNNIKKKKKKKRIEDRLCSSQIFFELRTLERDYKKGKGKEVINNSAIENASPLAFLPLHFNLLGYKDFQNHNIFGTHQ